MNFPITTDVGLSFIIKEKAKLKNKLRHKKITSTSVMSPSESLNNFSHCIHILCIAYTASNFFSMYTSEEIKFCNYLCILLLSRLIEEPYSEYKSIPILAAFQKKPRNLPK